MSNRVLSSAVVVTLAASLFPVACGSTPGDGEVVDGSVADSAPRPDAAARDSGPPRCTSNDDCAAPTAVCDPASGACVGCLGDSDCPAGALCDPVGRACAPGCSATKECALGQTCCGATCHDLTTDAAHCNACDTACVAAPGSEVSCVQSACTSVCAADYLDCDGDPSNGCEQELVAGECACVPGETSSCYDGPAGTLDIGTCRAGTRTCAPSGLEWGPCENQVLPVLEVCANGQDDDCNGTNDDVLDADGDGWTRCDGDCCDSVADGCADPAAVNPGAFEVVGNGQDDDCSEATSDADPLAACSTEAKFNAVQPLDAARAIELCQTTTLNEPQPTRRWGVIDAQWRLADGTVPTPAQLGNITDFQAAVLENYGTGGVVPRRHGTMLGLSTGRMRDMNDPGFVAPAPGTSFAVAGLPPPAYLAAHDNRLPASAGCSGNCQSGSGANDAVNLRLTIRVPTNARSFSYAVRYFTAEYWSYACTQFNDFFLALIHSSAEGLPADRNISFDGLRNPLSVNNSFFETCVPKGCFSCPLGTAPLEGTGLRTGDTGGGTRWLVTSAPVVPGETITLEFMIFDVSDYISDSNALLDDFRWSTESTGVVTE